MVVMKVFISIVIVFFLCWTPLCVFILLIMVFPSLYAKDSCLIFAGLFFYVFPTLHTAINPIILFVSSTNFYKALKEMLTFNRFTWKFCCKCRRILQHNGAYELNQQNHTNWREQLTWNGKSFKSHGLFVIIYKKGKVSILKLPCTWILKRAIASRRILNFDFVSKVELL